jgi:hypothetical protein
MKVKDAYMQAFPFIEPIDNDDAVKAFHPGMTLRDFLAAHSIKTAVYMVNHDFEKDEQEFYWNQIEREIVAERAYELADELMKARDKC